MGQTGAKRSRFEASFCSSNDSFTILSLSQSPFYHLTRHRNVWNLISAFTVSSTRWAKYILENIPVLCTVHGRISGFKLRAGIRSSQKWSRRPPHTFHSHALKNSDMTLFDRPSMMSPACRFAWGLTLPGSAVLSHMCINALGTHISMQHALTCTCMKDPR